MRKEDPIQHRRSRIRQPNERSLNVPRPEVYRGNGLGMVLAGVGTLVLVGALLTPWWAYSISYQGDQVHLTIYPGTTYVQACSGQNCSAYQGPFTYSSTGLFQTGLVLEGLETALGIDLLVSAGCFLVGMITWVDRARLGAVKTTLASAVAAGGLSLGTSVWISAILPGAMAVDTSGLTGVENLGPLGGWFLPFIAAALFFAAAVSEGSTLRYAKPWDAPLSTAPPPPREDDLPFSAPPDRVLRVESLWRRGTISEEDFIVQKLRILSPESIVGPVPIPPNAGTREAARAHLDYLRESGWYSQVDFEIQRQNVLRAYGLSEGLLFPEEELEALLVRMRAHEIGTGEFDRRKKEILDRI